LIAAKRIAFEPSGFEPPPLNPSMFPHQKSVTEFALRQGCAALFLSTGLGKTLCALEWARAVMVETGKPVLMLAPLACGRQHVREAGRFGEDAILVREAEDVLGRHLYVTNYERMHKFDPSIFGGVVLDESSIIKNFTGSTTRALMAAFANTPYRLCCTATPAPNDHMELGQHAQFLGIMDSSEMLSRWFIADQSNMGRYRLKKGAIRPFWDWVASWARACTLPSDLGFSDDGFVLPPLNIHRHVLRADISQATGEYLFRIPTLSATSIHKEKRLSAKDRATVIADLVKAEPNEPWLIWCDTDYEADALTEALPGAIEVRGSMSPEKKEEGLAAFLDGTARILITKPRVAGFGLNLQHCARVAFIGLSFSYEQFFQAVRRCWRFGQTRPVECHVAMADTERAIYDAITRKRDDHELMSAEMAAAMSRAMRPDRALHSYCADKRAPIPSFLGRVT
jgi:hypothetical protein